MGLLSSDNAMPVMDERLALSPGSVFELNLLEKDRMRLPNAS
jgi:hypothetical protein